MGGSGGEGTYFRQEVFVRADQATRVDAGFQLGILQGKVALPDGEQGEIAGNLMLYAGATSVPPDVAEFQKTNPVVQVQVRAGAFKSDEIQSGDWLAVLKIRGREPVQKIVNVPIGEGSPVDFVAGKAPQKK
jgi:hypothetical protein